jgi:AraC-like DNA-binding protein
VVWSGASKFDDPYAFQASVKPAQVELLVTAKGEFKAELTRVELSSLWVQHGSENLPRVAHSAVSVDRPPIFFLTRADQAPIRHSGREFGFGEIAVAGSGSIHHHRTEGPCHWATLSIPEDNLAAASRVLVGSDPTSRSTTHYLRPSPRLISRVLHLHGAARQLANDSSDLCSRPEPARALEQSLLHAMISCLSETTTVERNSGAHRHSTIIARLEEFLGAHYDRPLHLPEICAAVGASERTLRVSCIEHLGMGPIRYLWLRRMHLARRALIVTASTPGAVTEIATANGFWELGRFAVEYRALFGEAPSATLRREPEDMRKAPNNPFVFADSEFA